MNIIVRCLYVFLQNKIKYKIQFPFQCGRPTSVSKHSPTLLDKNYAVDETANKKTLLNNNDRLQQQNHQDLQLHHHPQQNLPVQKENLSKSPFSSVSLF